MQNKAKTFSLFLMLLLGLGAIILAVLPYETLKAILSAPMPDGNFKSLKEENALVFRMLFVLAGLSLAGFGYTIQFTNLRKWLAERRAEVSSLAVKENPLTVLLVFAVTVLGAIVRLPRLWAPLNHDEAYTAVVFAPSLWGALVDYHAPNNHIFHSILVHFSTAAFGQAAWAVRLPAYLAGLLMLPATYALGKALYGKHAGLAAALIFASLPAAIGYTTSARGYSLVGLFTLLVLWLGFIALKQKNTSAWLLMALCMALGMWTIPLMIFPFGMVFAWLFFEGIFDKENRAAFFKPWLASGLVSAALAFVLYSPVFIFTGLAKFLGTNIPLPWEQVPALLWQHITGIVQDWHAGIPAGLAWLTMLGLLLGIVFHRKIASHRVPILLPGLIWFAVLILVERPAAWSRIWFFLLAPALIWCTAGFTELLKDMRLPVWKKPQANTLLAGILLFWLAIQSALTIWDMPRATAAIGKDETAILFIKDQLRETDLIIAPSPEDAALWYYSTVHGIDLAYFNRERSYERVFVFTLPSAGQYIDKIIAEYSLNNINPETLKQIQDFSGLKIFLLETY